MNNRINFQALNYITDQDALLRYVDETPIMPKKMSDMMKNHYSQGGIVQTYAINITTQPPITLPDLGIGDIKTIQKKAASHANDWLNNIDPKVIEVYTDAKQYTNFIVTFDEQDINGLIDDLKKKDTVNFLQMIAAFSGGAEDNRKKIDKLTTQLDTFRTNISNDSGKFQSVKAAADKKYKTDKGEMKALQDKMNKLSVDMINCNKSMVETVLEQPINIVVDLFTFNWGKLFCSDIIGKKVINQQTAKQLAQDKVDYGNDLNQYNDLNATCNILQGVSNQVGPLITANLNAIAAVQTIDSAWGDIASNLKGIRDHVDKFMKNLNNLMMLKHMLLAFISDANGLNTLVTKYETAGVIPMQTTERVWHWLHEGRRVPPLPEFLSLDNYLALVNRRKLLAE